jgi:hypothetical protein
MTMGFADRFKEVMQQREGQVRSAVDKAGSFVDEKTKGKYHQQITKAGQKADEMITKSTQGGQSGGPGGYRPPDTGYQPPADGPGTPPQTGPTD